MSFFRSRYGEGPLHALAVLGSLAIATYAFLELAERPAPLALVVWFVAAALVHDLIAFPLYSLFGRLAGRSQRASDGPRREAAGAVNYLRVPALLSGFALIVWFPLILGLSKDNYESFTGLASPDYLARWLLLSGVLFAGSGLLFALRSRRTLSTRS